MDIASTAAASQTAPTPSTTQAEQSASALSSDFETFLMMLTTQMENQDPLNPIESSDFAVQLATFSGVEQAVRTNELLEGLTESMAVGGLGQIAGWVGREGRADVPVAFSDAPVTVYPDLPADADQASLIVRDAAGREVSRTAIPVSDASVTWPGTDSFGVPLPPGLYSFETEARAAGDLLGTSPAEVYAEITEVRLEGGQGVVVFSDGSTRSSADVSGIRAAPGDTL
jgi:flagellar basal-body rod modification protein FlgD